MPNKRVHITDLGDRYIFVEADVPSKIFTEILEEFKQQGFNAFGIATGNN